MPTPTKFTGETRQQILEALQVGASRRTAAAIARVDEATLRRWMEQGKSAGEGTRFREFYTQVLEAEAHPRMRALGIIYRAMEDKPDFAWKFAERRESGFAPPMPQALQAAPQVQIQLSFHDGGALAPSVVQSFIEGEVVEQDEEPSPRSLPAAGTPA
jgi:transposase-like protein